MHNYFADEAAILYVIEALHNHKNQFQNAEFAGKYPHMLSAMLPKSNLMI